MLDTQRLQIIDNGSVKILEDIYVGLSINNNEPRSCEALNSRCLYERGVGTNGVDDGQKAVPLSDIDANT
jgi:hypothetical protein